MRDIAVLADELGVDDAAEAIDVIVELSKVIPTSMVHDIEEFDMQRGKVKITGIVGSTADAQSIASEIGRSYKRR